VAAAVLVVAVAAGGWFLLRRAPAPESTLPRATPAGTSSSTALEPDHPSPSSSSSPASSSVASTSSSSSGSGASGGPVTVHVAGAVARPGVVSLPAGSRAVDAVAAAGGMAPGADPDRVNLAAKLADGERLVVPVVGQPAPAEVPPASAGAPGSSGSAPGGVPSAPIDLNSATAEQLDELPGVGPATAAAIVSYRDAHGPFRSVDGLLDVRGIGDAKLDALRDLVTVGS
jgi:competence protein ComEA